MKLELRNLQKSFDSVPVLQGVNIKVEPGELVCLIGASGSGKSTLLRCINLLEPIDDGLIFLDGQDISDPELDPQPIRQKIGLVFQSYNLFPHMTALENVMLAPRRIKRQTRAELLPEIRNLFKQFGLDEHLMHYPDQLSGGQQQRVAIIRALAVEPEVLLFDEITSALDPELVGEVLAALRQLKRSGMTMVMATHEMGFARELADKVCFLASGHILEQGSPADIFDKPIHDRTKEFLGAVL
ncbi:MAG: amino acid ABC transporter ATP-binding protein [Granulosicoccus sp.]|nr:amino acid ABC transporter ATP-binding protein [Granulosicoccus sp.]